ncbi:hypothetical protein ACFSTI_03680 [Rhizorhabdus histidinilytica]
MHEPSPIAPRAFVDEGDAVVAALDLIGRDGIEAIGAAFAALGRAGLDPAGAEGQPVLIEAVFHLLERLERDPATPLVPSIVLRLDPMVAAAAAELLLIANFPKDRAISPIWAMAPCCCSRR